MLSLKQCDKNKPCPLHDVVYSSKSKLIKNLKGKTVHDLSFDIKFWKFISTIIAIKKEPKYN